MFNCLIEIYVRHREWYQNSTYIEIFIEVTLGYQAASTLPGCSDFVRFSLAALRSTQFVCSPLLELESV